MLIKHSRIFASFILILIVIYGVFRVWVLRVYSILLNDIAHAFHSQDNLLFALIRDYARKDEYREQTLGWLIYYPTYFTLHLLFIYVLFSKNNKARKYLMLGLTGLITMLVSCWILFDILDKPEISYFFRQRFKSLFGLPFILLIIEGGRILYGDVRKLTQIK